LRFALAWLRRWWSRARGRLRDGGAARRRELGQAAGEIAQMQVQLIERKADGEDALHRVVRQFARGTSSGRGVAAGTAEAGWEEGTPSHRFPGMQWDFGARAATMNEDRSWGRNADTCEEPAMKRGDRQTPHVLICR